MPVSYQPQLYHLSHIDQLEVCFQKDYQNPWALILDVPSVSIAILTQNKKNNYTEEYLNFREAFWLACKQKYGDKLWNGTVCTVETIRVKDQKIILEMGKCEYKDIMYKNQVGLEKFKAFGLGRLIAHSFTCILPILKNKQIVLGVVGAGTVQSPGLIDIIGGTLNLDEKPITSFENIQQMTVNELQEETGMKISLLQLIPYSINYHDGCCFFLFVVKMQTDSIMSKFQSNDELSRLLCISLEALKKQHQNMTNDVKFMLAYADCLNRDF